MGSFQTSVSVRPDALGPAGSRYGAGQAPPRHGINNSPNTAKVMTATVVYAATQTITAVINGVPIAVATNTDAPTTRNDLVTAINASAFVNTEVVAAPGAGNTLTITALVAGVDFTLTGSGTGASDITPIAVTVANSAEQPMDAGLFVKRGSTPGQILKLATGDALANIVGLVEHRHEGAELEDLANSAQYKAHSQVPYGYRGEYVVEFEDAVAAGATPFVRITPSGANQITGKLRSDADGGNAIALTGAVVGLGTSGAGKGTVRISFA